MFVVRLKMYLVLLKDASLSIAPGVHRYHSPGRTVQVGYRGTFAFDFAVQNVLHLSVKIR